jgi:hypothetical protein
LKQPRGSSRGLVSSRDGIVASDGQQLWFWTQRMSKNRGLDCECFGFPDSDAELAKKAKECAKEADQPYLVFVDTTGKEVVAVEPASAPSSVPAGDYAEADTSLHLDILAVWGPGSS